MLYIAIRVTLALCFAIGTVYLSTEPRRHYKREPAFTVFRLAATWVIGPLAIWSVLCLTPL